MRSLEILTRKKRYSLEIVCLEFRVLPGKVAVRDSTVYGIWFFSFSFA